MREATIEERRQDSFSSSAKIHLTMSNILNTSILIGQFILFRSLDLTNHSSASLQIRILSSPKSSSPAQPHFERRYRVIH